jgi:hypothetical protein
VALLGEPQFVPISAAASGANTLVAAQGAGVKIRVLGIALVAASAVTATLQSGAGGTNLTGAMSLGGASTKFFTIEEARLGILETAANALLNLNLSGAVQVSGWLVWCTSQ